ncbi:SusC/RagA family TonB-linked outer membrane protein [Sinomicrobium weinanense]|uniref:TonB-dependent receptor n=1 Tax=Sinomicrobium weinanense TaxID=2842200 RepID=A0A926JVJ1_9FLAO|nr:TonB-dependent receptor [Sinomicrobium weinanense]MBC9798260.1 TonB-dependent receptor [Sinomicrobium weinanense]MBU3122635.1 TonB-dependent receptor [Sinomicrobium weinanense]
MKKNYQKRRMRLYVLLLFCGTMSFAQKKVSGVVTSEDNNQPLPGVSVLVVGTTTGVSTDFDGKYSISVPDDNSTLEFSYIGMISQQVKVGGKATINITLKTDVSTLDEVVVVGYDTQTKESLVGSITQVKPKDLKIPSSNLTTALAGRVAGMISYQPSGEPGQDNAQFFIRGATTFGIRQSPLILIDGIELTTNDLARMLPDDIESFSVFKDATATAIYGARGANGVISVTTKTGEIGKPKVNLRYESSLSQPTKNVEFADPLTYLRLHNEAVRTRDPLAPLPYAQNKIDNTLLEGSNPNVYPYVDWQDELLKDFTINQRVNFSVAGGGKVARYYVAGGFSQDNGILKVDNRNNFNNNIDLKKFSLRSNVNINLTKTTEAIVRLNATIDDYTGPIPGGSQVYNMITRSNPVRFPAYFEPDEANEFTEHILFGNDEGGNFLNPYAELVRGYRDYSRSLNLVQLEVKQELSFVAPGLRWRFLGNINRTSAYGINRAYNPFYYRVGLYNSAEDKYTLTPLNEDSGTEFLTFDPNDSDRIVNSVIYMETALNYDHTFKEKHTVSGLLVGIIRDYVDGNAQDLQLSLPSRNVGLSGRFTYDYDRRYFVEFNFGYNGSERFSKDHRFGFFPSVGAGWVISNEKFWNIEAVNRLKIRGSYGVVGNDAIGDRNDRFFYLSNVNLIDNSRGASFGTNFDFFRPGVSISRYENRSVTWETAYKKNFGLEINMFNDAIQFQGELFSEKRTNILQTRSDIPSLVGLQAPIRANVGKAKSRGFELTLDINHQFNENLWVSIRSNYVDTRSEFTVFEEPDYAGFGTPWLSKVGRPLNQAYGFIAERLFVDEEDVANSPRQDFGEVMGGDIKYKDINGDGVITDLDRVPIGESTQPEVSYGFGFSIGYKNFDISAFFQGLGRMSFFIDAFKLTPFSDTDVSGDPYYDYLPEKRSENQIIQAFADNHWSEDNRDIYAMWPRLSTYPVSNNTRTNTWFMRDGAFIRLKQAEIGYNIKGRKGGLLGLADIRIYLSGTNLVHWSKFKLWDPELRGKGFNYPLQRVINLGARVNF